MQFILHTTASFTSEKGCNERLFDLWNRAKKDNQPSGASVNHLRKELLKVYATVDSLKGTKGVSDDEAIQLFGMIESESDSDLAKLHALVQAVELQSETKNSSIFEVFQDIDDHLKNNFREHGSVSVLRNALLCAVQERLFDTRQEVDEYGILRCRRFDYATLLETLAGANSAQVDGAKIILASLMTDVILADYATFREYLLEQTDKIREIMTPESQEEGYPLVMATRAAIAICGQCLANWNYVKHSLDLDGLDADPLDPALLPTVAAVERTLEDLETSDKRVVLKEVKKRVNVKRFRETRDPSQTKIDDYFARSDRQRVVVAKAAVEDAQNLT
jgi:hypothetical protein